MGVFQRKSRSFQQLNLEVMAKVTDTDSTSISPDDDQDSGFIDSRCPSTCRVHYKVYKNKKLSEGEHAVNVLMIHGLACPNEAWWPQLDELAVNEALPMRVCAVDNRGIGRSSVPADKKMYTTQIMAEDVIAVMDQLQWESAHVVGFSMGAMIASKLAVSAPQRVLSLSLLAVSGGGLRSLPHCWKGWKYAVKGMVAKTDKDRAHMDLKFHFSRSTLRAQIVEQGMSRREQLLDEYVSARQPGKAASKEGVDGQLMACWRHSLSKKEIRTMERAGFPILILHGRYDALANPSYSERLARRLGTVCVMLDGAHFIPRECRREVNSLLLETFRSSRTAPLFRCASHREFK